MQLLRALELDPDSIAARVTLGDAVVRFKRFGEAEAHLRRAFELESRSAAMHQKFRRGAQKATTLSGSYRVVPRGSRDQSGIRVRQCRHGYGAVRCVAIRRGARGAGIANRSWRRAACFILLGGIARELGRFEAAAEHFQRAAELDPDNVEPLLDLAALRRRQQRDR